MKNRIFIFLLVLLASDILFSFDASGQNKNQKDIKTGADSPELYLPKLKDKRVGVLVNPTSRTHGKHLVDFLIDNNINVALIFAPEHGFRGEHGAGEVVKNNRDPSTGIEIISLHGKIKKPLKEHIDQLDILLFDIKDVGVRYYTYISSMHYFMESCADNQIPIVILDRPNPNGDYIAGPVLDLEYQSFVGMHPIPVVHGLTVAELANMIQGEGWLNSNKSCKTHIVANQNYDHGMSYSLPVKPSPNLPNDRSVRLYPSLGFFEATPVSVGRGTNLPFQVLGYSNRKMGNFSFKPTKIRGSWKDLNHAGTMLFGENLSYSTENGQKYNKMDLSLFIKWYQIFKKNELNMINRPKFLAKLSGSKQLEAWVGAGKSAEQIENLWRSDLLKYQKIRKKYLLYKDSDYLTNF